MVSAWNASISARSLVQTVMLALLCACHASPASGGSAAVDAAGLWPLPANVSSGEGTIGVSRAVRVDYDGAPCAVASYVQARLRETFSTGVGIHDVFLPENSAPDGLGPSHSAVCSIDTIRIVAAAPVDIPHPATDESYELTVPSCGQVGTTAAAQCTSTIEIRAPTAVGAAHATETLLQLVRARAWELVILNAPWQIADAPRFVHRGLLLDCSRNFLPIDTLRATVRAMAASKLNVLHWHLTDAPSFPLDLPSARSLAREGAYSAAETYSVHDVEGLVAYAAERGIRVVPEIDMPGHAFSWRGGAEGVVACANAQPWELYCNEPPCGQLDPTLEETFVLVEAVVGDVARMFPDALMHLGADEVLNGYGYT
jgi:hypothetical protein